MVVHVRHVVDFRDAHGKRRQIFFANKQEAVEFRDDLIVRAERGDWRTATSTLTLSDVLNHWLAHVKQRVRPQTWDSYKRCERYIVGPLVLGSARERRDHTRGIAITDLPTIDLLGSARLADLTTAQLRSWHNALLENVGKRTAQEMRRCLSAALKLAAEDFDIVPPTMPSGLHRRQSKTTKRLLSPSEVGQLLRAAQMDSERGIYYAFPFLTGVRPSEQLGLLWDAVDLVGDTIVICRTQGQDGTLSRLTKTSAGLRTIPLPGLLKQMLLHWKSCCPEDVTAAGRVFPTLGQHYRTGRRSRQGLPLTYQNFRSHYWRPALAACGLPYVTPHSARHTFVSAMQAAGAEVGLVAKIAGHANANVTLAYYTHAVRGGADAVNQLQELYGL
ncbi:MAG: site-specific integrase [Hyphomicrobiales bacterium]|nr:MAG: site-specific integrase [Hyphomicrobiales bacterium]